MSLLKYYEKASEQNKGSKRQCNKEFEIKANNIAQINICIINNEGKFLNTNKQTDFLLILFENLLFKTAKVHMLGSFTFVCLLKPYYKLKR